MRQLQELLKYVAQALDLSSAAPVHRDLRRAYERLDALTRDPAETLLAVDLDALRGEVNPLLLRASELARAAVPGRGKNHRGPTSWAPGCAVRSCVAPACAAPSSSRPTCPGPTFATPT